MDHCLHNMFYCLQAPFGIPNVLPICHLSSYHPTFLLGMLILFLISILIPTSLPFKFTLKTYSQTYLTNLPYKPTIQPSREFLPLAYTYLISSYPKIPLSPFLRCKFQNLRLVRRRRG